MGVGEILDASRKLRRLKVLDKFVRGAFTQQKGSKQNETNRPSLQNSEVVEASRPPMRLDVRGFTMRLRSKGHSKRSM
jgi:hypothetical protein